ncbi:sigma-54-dependent Fis family transcriptional regulator [Peredibacter sp. HCB2-198]|uniref:sigma-54-dependent Fis family transcriptional regulator n=1 Tax=Peredibacter sp. HCB2-198 TaxID=3383025 RepID=UPI0038B5326F
MLTSFSEFKYYQSFRVPVESRDDVQFLVEYENDQGRFEFVEKIKLMDVSMTGLGFTTSFPLPVGATLRCSLQFKRLRFDFGASVVRAFRNVNSSDSEAMNYGAELDTEDYGNMKRFIEQYIQSLPPERLKDSLIQLALTQHYASEKEGFEMFSLLLSLFKDITQFGNKEKFVESMLEEIVRILNGQRASIFLINTETNELEAVAALGIDKELLKFDYRKGIAGSVFTTGVSLNIDTQTDKVRFSEEMDKVTGFDTRSIICSPITNREDKIIGVIEVLNKRNEDRFTVEDEKTMKVLALILSSVFHHYSPVSEKSLIRRFSTPYDREWAWIGRSQQTSEIRKAIVRLKDIDSPLMISGETGVGKKLFARIVHNEGKRGLAPYVVISCKGVDEATLQKEIFGTPESKSKLEECVGGSIVFDEISFMPVHMQMQLMQVLKDRRIPGSHISLDVRPMFTTSKNLKQLIEEEGAFNPELYHYMCSSEVNIDPLRKRPQDIEDLLSFCLRKECRKQGLLLKDFSDVVKDQLVNYAWPGNVSELEKAVEKAVLYNPKAHVITDLGSKSSPIIDVSKTANCLLENIPHADDPAIPLKDRVALVEREMILAEIKRHKGNKSKAATAMGISREALRKKMLMSDEIIEGLNNPGKAPAPKPTLVEDEKEAA